MSKYMLFGSLSRNPLDYLENVVNQLWGNQRFDWDIVGTSSVEDSSHKWFWMCGTSGVQWKHTGYANTLSEALSEMIRLAGEPSESPRDEQVQLAVSEPE